MSDKEESNIISINILHPTEVGKQLHATVSVTATPRFVIEQLIANGFLAEAGAATQYRLVDTATGNQLFDHLPLEHARLHDDSYLQAIHSVTGARS